MNDIIVPHSFRHRPGGCSGLVALFIFVSLANGNSRFHKMPVHHRLARVPTRLSIPAATEQLPAAKVVGGQGSSAPRSPEAYGRLPLSFERNDGQADSEVKFLAHGRGYELFLAAGEARMTLDRQPTASDKAPLKRRWLRYDPSLQKPKSQNDGNPQPAASEVVSLRLVGAKRDARVIGCDELRGKSNYYIGNDPKKWRTGIPNYSQVRYRGIYSGIDLVYRGNQGGQLEYDFVVAPGADPAKIRFTLRGRLETGGRPSAASSRRQGQTLGQSKFPILNYEVDPNGDLLIQTKGRELCFRKPVIYQSIEAESRGQNAQGNEALSGAGARANGAKLIAGHYFLRGNHEVGFAISAYDHSRPLIIDPVLAYSTYWIGEGGAVGVGLDSSGNAYILGRMYSGGTFEAELMALNPQGNQVIFTTDFGPTGGSNGPSAIAVDPQGNSYITGNGATGMPTTPGAFEAACPSSPSCNTPFSAKFSPTGTLTYATLLGPSNAVANAIAFDGAGDAYITGTTASNDLPVVNAFQSQFAGASSNAFVQKLNSGGTQLIYSTYFGLGATAVQVIGTGVAVDGSGSAYVVGNGSSVPLQNPLEQGVGGAFLAKFTPDGTALVYSTNLGGSGGVFYGQVTSDTAAAVAVDASGNAYVTGDAASPDFPTTMTAYKASCNESALEACVAPQVYVLKVDPNGASLLYSTLIGAGTVANIALGTSGSAWVAGTTSSNYYPALQAIESGLQQNSSPESNEDAFVTMLNSSGIPTFSTYLGGSISSQTGVGVAVDNSGNGYVVGSLGSPNDAPVDFPVVNPVTQPQAFTQFAFPGALFAAKISSGAGPALSLSPWYVPILQLRDVSASPLTINSIKASSTLTLEGGTCGSSLAPGGGCTLIVYPENPQAPANGTLTISTNAVPASQTFNIQAFPPSQAYSPVGITPFVVSPDYLEFPVQLVGSTSAAQTVTITNLDYPTAVAIKTIQIYSSNTVESSSGDVSQTNNCPASLAAGESCTINLQFQPTAGADGPDSSQLQITTGTSPSDYTVSLTGLRSSESIVPSTQSTQYAYPNSSVQFGTQFVGATPLPRVISLTNADVQPVTVSGFTVTGPFSQTNNCTGPLASHATCRVALSFVPVANGVFTGTVNVASSGRGSPAVINLGGTGLVPSALGISPLSLSFGSVLVGATASLPLTLTNSSTTTLTNLQFDLSTNFSQTNNCGGSLAPAATCTVTVSFAPSALGAVSGTLSIPFTGIGSPQVLSLSGTGTTALSILPQELSFGDQRVGAASSPQSVSMGNGGSAPLTVSSIAISGDFQILDNSCPSSIAANIYCTLEVEFKPTATGSRSGALTVIASDFEGTHVIPLSGTGVDLPVVGFSPTSVSFAGQLVSSASGVQVVTVSNSGNASLQISSVNISGPFTQTNTCSAAVAVNSSCSISVSFTPTVSGQQAGTLTLTDNAADSPESMPLSGTGEDFTLAAASGSSTSSTVTPGQTATYNLTVAPASGLTGSVSLTCTGAPSEATCAVSPSSAPLSGSSATPITVTVTTTAASGAGFRPQPPTTHWNGLWMLVLLAAIGAGVERMRRFRARAPLALITLCLLLWVACGGEGGGTGTSPVNLGTSPGTYSIKVTGTYTAGSSTLQHNLSLTLSVN